MKLRSGPKKSQILLYVFFVMTLVAIFFQSLSYMWGTSVSVGSLNQMENLAFYAAQAGLEHGKAFAWVNRTNTTGWTCDNGANAWCSDTISYSAVGGIQKNATMWYQYNVTSNSQYTPPSRANATMVAATHNNQLYLFGGQNATSYLNDFYVYGMANNTWSTLTPAGGPSARANFAAAYDDTSGAQKMYLFGGHDGSNVFGETYAYDVNANTWSQLVPAISSTDWYDFNYQHRIAITVDHTKVGAALTNFPVYLNLADLTANAPGFWTKVRSDGGDILLTDSSGNRLSVEVVAINTAAHTGEVYFNAAALSNTVNTVFYLYYDYASGAQPAANAAYGENAVWANGYAAVWHLQEAPANGAAGNIDSTGHGNNGTPQSFTGGATSTTNAAGKIGKAIYFDGVAAYVNVPDSASLGLTTGMTISAYVNPTTFNVDYEKVLVKSITSGSAPYSSYSMSFDTKALKYLRGEVNVGGTQYHNSGNTVISTGAWTYGTVTYDGTNLKTYVNGALQTTLNHAGTIVTNTYPVTFGCSNYSPTKKEFFYGLIDETRVSNVARAATWISTEYNNFNSSSTFYTISAEVQAAPLGRWGMAAGFDNGGSTRNMYIFGGATDVAGSNRSNKVYYFDALTSKWHQVITSGGTALTARIGSAGYHDPNGQNHFYIYGGYDGTNYLADHERIDITGVWDSLASGSASAYHTMAFEKQGGSFAYVFGGVSNSGYSSQFKMYQVKNGGGTQPDTWYNLFPSGTAPTARAYHMAAFDDQGANRCMYLYGGYNGTSYLGDFYKYDHSAGNADGQWTLIASNGAASNATIRAVGRITEPITNRTLAERHLIVNVTGLNTTTPSQVANTWDEY